MTQHDPGSAVQPALDDQQAPRPSAAPVGRAVREIVETLLLAAIIFLGVRLVVLNFRVDGESMAPNLQNEEMLLVNRNAYWHFDAGGLLGLLPGDDGPGPYTVYPFSPPERGDIVVFDPPQNSDKPYIKRVIGLPGETVSFRGGSVLINGVPLDEPYIEDRTRCRSGEECDVVVPEGYVYVLGDNRNNSSDSRVFGPITIDSIVGKAWVGYWPPSSIGFVPHYDYPGIPETPDGARAGPAASAASSGRRDRPARPKRGAAAVATSAP